MANYQFSRQEFIPTLQTVLAAILLARMEDFQFMVLELLDQFQED